MSTFTRRRLLLGGLGLAGTGALAACTGTSAGPTTAASPGTFGTPPPVSPAPGQRVVAKTLTAKPVTLDLGGPTVQTWAYDDSAPGPLIRATAGDLIRVRVDNQLPADTTIHWHGIALPNRADGVPGLTQDPIRPSTAYTYEFTAPDPGTYFYHPHVGVQLDRGLYAPLIIDDPREPGRYDAEWVIVLDDWVDGTGRTPDDVLKTLTSSPGSTADGTGGMPGMDHGSMGAATGSSTATGGMPGMDHGSMGAATGSSTATGGMGGMAMGAEPFGDAGDVAYPHYLINGRIPTAANTFTAKPGQRVRLRVINAAADTIFTVALGGHRMTVTHSDGFAVQPRETDAFYIGMGERYDVTVTLTDGVFPLVAVPFGKEGQAAAIVRTGAGAAPTTPALPRELTGSILQGSQLLPADQARLPARAVDATAPLTLTGQMAPYQWGINGAPFGKNEPITVGKGQRLRLDVTNMTMMAHPLHLHGHTFALAGSGLRKDTVMLRPMESMPVEIQADNPGQWAAHCHNIYHAEAGMMIALKYRA
jgi:FtsP/CotA-like multicopper oxidase with cupredoxin domain